MTVYENILLDSIDIISPILMYLFFVAYNKNVDRDESGIILEICLITSCYFVIRFGHTMMYIKPVLLVNIPLLIAYYNKKYASVLVISLYIIFYQHSDLNLNVILLFVEYFSYMVVYFIIKKIKTDKTNEIFAFFYSLINSLIFVSDFYKTMTLQMITVQILSFLLMLLIVKVILEKARRTIKYHMTVKELIEEKQIRKSLFKITHEIKNPLAVCKGYLDMFDVNNVEHARKYVPILKEEIDRTLILLQDFLSFTKIKIEKDILDINYLLEEVLDNLHLLLKDKNIELESNILDEEVYIDGDYNRLCQVMINLIKNSIEAMKDVKYPQINLSSVLKKDYIEIVVEDNGTGIEEKNLKKISEPFFTTKKHGTGLGVSMSFEIIASHNGTIKYFSEYGKGTKVVINLPLNKEFNSNCAH